MPLRHERSRSSAGRHRGAITTTPKLPGRSARTRLTRVAREMPVRATAWQKGLLLGFGTTPRCASSTRSPTRSRCSRRACSRRASWAATCRAPTRSSRSQQRRHKARPAGSPCSRVTATSAAKDRDTSTPCDAQACTHNSHKPEVQRPRFAQWYGLTRLGRALRPPRGKSAEALCASDRRWVLTMRYVKASPSIAAANGTLLASARFVSVLQLPARRRSRRRPRTASLRARALAHCYCFVCRAAAGRAGRRTNRPALWQSVVAIPASALPILLEDSCRWARRVCRGDAVVIRACASLPDADSDRLVALICLGYPRPDHRVELFFS